MPTVKEVVEQIKRDYDRASLILAEGELVLVRDGVNVLCILAAYTFAQELLIKKARQMGVSQERIDFYVGFGIDRAEKASDLSSDELLRLIQTQGVEK